jgi:hypothetical protein
MKPLIQLRKLATSLSLLILALGFSGLGLAPLLGFAPLPARDTGCAEALLSGDKAYSFIGSGFSILVGAIFLSAAIYFTRLLQVTDRRSVFPYFENNISEKS